MPPRTLAVIASAIALVLASCNKDKSDRAGPSTSSAPSASASVSASASAVAEPPAIPPDGRELAKTATFGDLVATAIKIGATDKAASTAGCNLRRLRDGSFRYEATIAAGTYAPPPTDLDDLVTKTGPGVILATPYGNVGTGSGITLQTLSPLPKSIGSSLVPAFFITDGGVYMKVTIQRGMSFGSGAVTKLQPSEVDRVKRELAPRAEAIIVVAEPDVKLDRVREVLEWVEDAKGPVVFAVPLGKDARVPKAASGAKAPLGADGCPGGADLMDIPKGSVPGEYSMTKIGAVTDDHKKDAMQCSAKLPPGNAGGRMKIDFRIEPDGKVSKACVIKDEIGDAALRTCVLEKTRAHVFEKPEKQGIVNMGTELSFVPPGTANRALCP